ncbi:21246_t:CDS:2 [Gigaspora margarita]|uniref:21246_t:CDS:1 n=1 Tax=Gigaspora margarita TaxID=4874 RepID=A0ABN7W3U7_GIGMA|nr:21246_t:CDS:2 [Gigaspora margarita]
MSEISSRTSTSTMATEDSSKLAHVVKNKTAIKILKKEEINGCNFLKISKEKLRNYRIPGGPASRLSDFTKELSKWKLRAYSSYKSLKKVLRKYRLDNNGTEVIPLFNIARFRILTSTSHIAWQKLCNTPYCLNITRDNMQKKFSMRPQYGNESTKKVDYTIKDFENFICVMENKQHQIPMGIAQNICQLESSPREISQGSKSPYTIKFTENVLNEKSEKYQILRKSVKRVLGIIVDLLTDRVCADKSGMKKKARIENYYYK